MRCRRVCIIAAALAVFAGRVMAQPATDQQEAINQAKETGYAWLAMVVALVLALAVVVASFMSSRRTHQD